MRSRIAIQHVDDRLPARTIVAAADVLDAHLTRVATTVIQTGPPVEVVLPRAGRYLIRGWTPSGQHILHRFDCGRNPLRWAVVTIPALDMTDGTDDEVAGPDWLIYWGRDASVWQARSMENVRNEPGRWLDRALPDGGPFDHGFALQIGGDGDDARVTIAPAQTELRVDRRRPWNVGVAPSTAATLLGYLTAGDLRAAGVVLDHLDRSGLLHVAGTQGPLFDLTVGYLLVAGGDERAGSWIDELSRQYPWSTDVTVLVAQHQMQREDVEPIEVRQAILATDGEMPAVAAGARWLVQSLDVLRGDIVFSSLYHKARMYLASSLRSPLTTFVASSPGQPGNRYRSATPPVRVPDRYGSSSRRTEDTAPAGAPSVSESTTEPLGVSPVRNSTFRGREAELEVLLHQHDRLRARLRADDLGSPRGRPLILLLHGKPGVGKTAIAHEFGRRLQAGYDLVLYANLGHAGDASEPGEVLGQFLRMLGVSEVPSSASQRLSLYRETVERYRALIILDAVRGPWQIADLLPNSIESTVLVTSRRDLGPEFGFRSHHLDVLTADDAIAMLYAVAQKDEPGYPMSASTITWLCGRLPRAISIVGGWVISDGRDLVDAANWLNFDDHIDETERLRRLVGPKENVRAGFETEYADLEPAQRRAFCLSALIQASSFTARTVAVLLDSTIEEAESLCGALRTAQFLDPDPETGPEVVYRLHPLVRLFAADRLQLDFAAEKAAARTRLDEDMARHVRAVGSVRSGQSAPDDAAGAAARDAAGNTYRWMRGHLPEIVRGLGSLPGGGDVLLLADLVTEAPGLLCRSYGLTDLSKLLRSGMGPDCAALTKVDLKVAFAAALIAVEDYVLAERVLNEARDLLPDGKPGDPELAFRQSAIWRTQATGYAQMRSPKIADAHFQRAYTCLDGITGERADYERRVITLLQYLSHGANLANVEYPPEEFGEAYRFWIHLERHEEYRNRRLWDQALAELDLAQECCTGDLRKETNVLYRRARLYLEHSEASPDTDRLRLANLAVRRAADAVRRFREMDNRVGQVRAGCLLVRALAAAGEIGEAALQWDAAQAIYDDGLQDVAGPAMDPLRARLIAARGELLLAQGEHTAASAEFLKAANQFDRISDGRGRQRYLNRIRR